MVPTAGRGVGDKMSYNGEDMIGDDGYGTWDEERLDKEYTALKKRFRALLEALELNNIGELMEEPPEKLKFIGKQITDFNKLKHIGRVRIER